MQLYTERFIVFHAWEQQLVRGKEWSKCGVDFWFDFQQLLAHPDQQSAKCDASSLRVDELSFEGDELSANDTDKIIKNLEY